MRKPKELTEMMGQKKIPKPTRDECVRYLEYYGKKMPKTKIYKLICKHYGNKISYSTVRQLFKAYCLTDQKYTTFKNRKLKEN